MASIPHISIAGACATGNHGSGDDQRVLASSVAAMQFVVSDGSLVELRRDMDRDKFRGWVGALGALGIVTQTSRKTCCDISYAGSMSKVRYIRCPACLQSYAPKQLGVVGRWHERFPHFRAALTLQAVNEVQMTSG
jgi:hypothetical protein